MLLYHPLFQARLDSFISLKVCAFFFVLFIFACIVTVSGCIVLMSVYSHVSSCLWLVVFFLAVEPYLVNLEICKLNLACLNIYSNNRWSTNTTHPKSTSFHRDLRIV